MRGEGGDVRKKEGRTLRKIGRRERREIEMSAYEWMNEDELLKEEEKKEEGMD